MKTVNVDAAALKQVLQALLGEPHHIRELQMTRCLGDVTGMQNPINTLVKNYNHAVQVEQSKDIGSGEEHF